MAVLRAGYKRGGVSALRGIPGLCPGPRSGIPTGPGAPVPRAAGSVLCPVRGRPCTLNAASVRRSVLKGTLRPAGESLPGMGVSAWHGANTAPAVAACRPGCPSAGARGAATSSVPQGGR